MRNGLGLIAVNVTLSGLAGRMKRNAKIQMKLPACVEAPLPPFSALIRTGIVRTAPWAHHVCDGIESSSHKEPHPDE